jgi:hypothetical protein
MTILLQKQLDYVGAQRIQQFRPSKFRRILPVDGSVPAWADRVQHSEIRISGEHDPKLIPASGPVGKLPRSTLSRADAFINILHFGYSYGYSIFDLERAAQTKINLPATEAIANQGIAERFLDAVAAGAFTVTYGLPGLLNQTATAATPGVATTTASLLTACAKASGGTTWVGATLTEIKRDIDASLYQINVNTLEVYTANLIALPPASMQYLTTTFNEITEHSLLQILMSTYPGVRFESWQRLATANAAGTGPRMVTMATGEEVARMIIPQELRDETPMQVPLAVEIPQWLSTAGVLVETPTAINYTDGI